MDGKLSFQAGYGHLFAGEYIQENLGTKTDQDWAYAQLWVNLRMLKKVRQQTKIVTRGM